MNQSDPFINSPILFLGEGDIENDGTLTISRNNPHTIYLCMVFANWCSPCKMTKPEYAKLAALLAKHKIDKIRLLGINATNLRAVDSSLKPYEVSEKKLANRLDDLWQKDGEPIVSGFPTIVFIQNGKVIGKHAGERSIDAFINALLGIMANSHHHVESKKVLEHYKETSMRV